MLRNRSDRVIRANTDEARLLLLQASELLERGESAQKELLDALKRLLVITSTIQEEIHSLQWLVDG